MTRGRYATCQSTGAQGFIGTRVIKKGGIIRVNKEDFHHPSLAAFVGREADVEPDDAWCSAYRVRIWDGSICIVNLAARPTAKIKENSHEPG